MKSRLFAAATLVALALVQCLEARAQKPVLDGPEASLADLHALWNARRMAWHAPYAYTPYGWPTALVVPPTAHMQTSYGWGVTNSQMTPIWHQFGPSAGNPEGLMGPPGVFAGPLYPTPYWPSHTDQFGVYYVRAPY
jgi:hypothetical protein